MKSGRKYVYDDKIQRIAARRGRGEEGTPSVAEPISVEVIGMESMLVHIATSKLENAGLPACIGACVALMDRFVLLRVRPRIIFSSDRSEERLVHCHGATGVENMCLRKQDGKTCLIQSISYMSPSSQ